MNKDSQPHEIHRDQKNVVYFKWMIYTYISNIFKMLNRTPIDNNVESRTLKKLNTLEN